MEQAAPKPEFGSNGHDRSRCHPLGGDGAATKALTVGDGFERVNPRRPGHNLWDQILYPSESPFAARMSVESINVAYPDREGWFTGSTVWLLWLIGLSFVMPYVLKPILRVEF